MLGEGLNIRKEMVIFMIILVDKVGSVKSKVGRLGDLSG